MATILSVINDAAVRESVARTLRGAGFELREAPTGTEALELLKTFIPDLVLLAPDLPDISSLEVCRRIKAGAQTARLPIVQFGGGGRHGAQGDGQNTEADVCLPDPVGPELLVGAVRTALRCGGAQEHARQEAETALIQAELISGRLRRLYTISTALSEAVTSEEVLDAIADRVMAATGAATGYIVLPDVRDGGLTCARIRGYPEESAAVLRHIDAGDSLPVADAVRTGVGVFVENAHHHPRYQKVAQIEADVPARALAAVPLVHHNRIQGALGLRFPAPVVFDSDYREFLTTIGRECGQALERARLYDEERHLREELEQEVAVRRRAEEQFRTLVDSMPVGVSAVDRTGSVTFYNDRAAEIWGTYPPFGAGEQDGGSFHLFYPDGRPVPGDEIPTARALSENRDFRDIEATVERPDGSRVNILANVVPIHDQSGAVTGALNAAVDVTELKRVERELRESRDLLTKTQQIARAGSFDLDLRSGRALWSEGLRRLYGMEPAKYEVDLNTWVEWVMPEDRERVMSVLTAWAETDGGTVQFRIRRLDNQEIRWIEARGQVLRDETGTPVRIIGFNIDTTEQKRTEEALRESQDRLTLAIESTGLGTFDFYPQTGKLVWSAFAKRHFGLPPDAEVDFDTFLRGLHPDDRERVSAIVERVLQLEAGGQYATEYRTIGLQDGVERRLSAWGRVLFDNEGRAARFIGVTLDITERARLEQELRRSLEELRESEARERLRASELRAILDAMPVATFICRDPDCREMIGSRLSYELLRMRPGTNLSKTDPTRPEVAHFRTANAGKEIPPQELPMQRAAALGEPVRDAEFDFVFDDGSCHSMLGDAVPLLGDGGGVEGVVAAFIDITARKRAVTELRVSEAGERARAAELHAVMDAVPILVFIARDPQCRHIAGNRATYDFLRMPQGSNLSKTAPENQRPAAFRIMKDGHELPAHELPVQKAAATGVALHNFEFEIVFDDGSSRYLIGDAVPLFGEDGSTRGAVGAFLDMTDHRRQEERLRQTQKLESIGVLAGGIAHDFNNLLVGIMGNASLIMDEVPSGAAERLKEIVGSAERAAHLTSQLLAYSGKGQFVVRDLDVSDAVNEVAGLVEFSIPRSVELAINLQRRLPVVRMDPSQLQQVLMNLVINAGEAIGEGNPGKITVATSLADVERPFVDAAGEEIEPGRYVRIEVSDTGTGIDGDNRSRIFDPFFTTKFTGRGLGLAAVAGILRSRRGAITVESAPGRGSRFFVYLPVADRGRTEPEPQPRTNGRTSVLVVDDEAHVRDFISAVLRRRGYRVLVASDAREALEAFDREQNKIDAVVLDLIMPAMGARELLPKITARKPDLRVLLTSGYSESEARRLCAEYRLASFIQKPYTAQQIAEAVERLLGTGPRPSGGSPEQQHH